VILSILDFLGVKMTKDATKSKVGRNSTTGRFVVQSRSSVFRIRKETDGSEVISLREATRKRANNAARIVLSGQAKKS